MSGHSKWSTIKRAKGAADLKRGQQFSKLSKAITVAAKQGGADPAGNPRLKLAIDTARSANMPKDNINRAIDKATSNTTENIDELVYEGYGPGGAALFIEVLTDNRNRTIAEVRTMLNKHGGSMGDAGSVAWMFKTQGVIELPIDGINPDDVSMVAIEAGASEIDQDDQSLIILTEVENLASVNEVVSQHGQTKVSVQPLATSSLELDEDSRQKLTNLINLLEDHDDIHRVSTNAEI